MIDLDGLSIFSLGGIVEACLSNMKMLDFYFFLQSYMNLRLTCTHCMIKLLLTIIFSRFRNLTILLEQ